MSSRVTNSIMHITENNMDYSNGHLYTIYKHENESYCLLTLVLGVGCMEMLIVSLVTSYLFIFVTFRQETVKV